MDFLKFLLMTLFFSLSLPHTASALGGPDFVQSLTSAEQDYYDKSFSYAMEALADDQLYEWRTSDADGKIRAGTYFTNKTGGQCRGFSEIYRIGQQEGQLSGYGCKRDGRDGWCKLREGNMMSCALEAPNSTVEQVVESVKNVQNKSTSYERQAKDYQHNKTEGFWSWWPF